MLHVIIVLVVLMNCSSSNSNCYMLFILYSMNVSYVKCFVSVITCFVITNIIDFYVNKLFFGAFYASVPPTKLYKTLTINNIGIKSYST